MKKPSLFFYIPKWAVMTEGYLSLFVIILILIRVFWASSQEVMWMEMDSLTLMIWAVMIASNGIGITATRITR